MDEFDEIKQKWSSIIGELDNVSFDESVDNFPSILPFSIKIASRTLSKDLVSVSPLPPPGISSDKLNQIKSEIKKENRDAKIDSFLEGKDYVEKTIEEHPDYIPYPVNLYYLDYNYDSSGTGGLEQGPSQSSI